jgi:hypothetical protein
MKMPLINSFTHEECEEWDKTKWPEPVPERLKPKPGRPAIKVICLICKRPIGISQEQKNMAMCRQCHKAIQDAEKNFKNTLTMTWNQYIDSLKRHESGKNKA